jgi:dCMP deaminase
MIINAGITRVVARNDSSDFTVTDVQDWVENDESLSGKFGY